MIPEAREVHLSRKDRKVLEACCRSPVTLQRDLKRARIVLLAADGRSTRSIAKEVGVQPRIVSLWRHRYADHGLEGLQDKPRPGKQPIYTKTTDKRILKLLDKPPPQGFARWTGPLLAEALGDVDCPICLAVPAQATRLTWWLASPGARATTRTLRPKPPMLSASMSRRRRRPLCCAWTRSPRSRLWSERRVI
ncbi:putative transposase [Bradyrhizobium diazoefficiens SEMIA 5080]|uniref:Putative transposase n=1 Tax=Bradyrhizobium diazoefficiens SEMIA 5080 TaxID=754504 RepID=A0A837C515_9BRAD|nr:putative transposase [Bradyrhizobium diazoefficiens SEMIA 5080]